MKKIFLTISLCGIVLFAGQSLFAQGQCQSNFTPIQCGYFQESYQDGAADAQNNRSNDYKRYRSKLEGSKYENFYKQGYDAGYSSIKPYQRWDKDQKSAYDAGFQKGDSDKRRNISRLPERYEGQYNRTYEAYFKQGYYDAFDGRSKQYDVPVGNIPPVNPNNPTFPTNPTNPTFPNNPTFPTNPVKVGTATGNISWNGRVDDRTNIVIQGDQVTEQVISGGGGFVSNKSMNGVLPRVASAISVSKQGGRGDAMVIQQPSRENNYVGIVQVVDTKRGSDDYRLQINWQATEPLEEPYQAGRVSWRGRVDQTANIIISGSSVQTQDASGTGVSDVSNNISGYLARRPGTVSVRKNRGRGTVNVLQQPTIENGFVAIVQVFDADRGAGDYEIEITW